MSEKDRFELDSELSPCDKLFLGVVVFIVCVGLAAAAIYTILENL